MAEFESLFFSTGDDFPLNGPCMIVLQYITYMQIKSFTQIWIYIYIIFVQLDCAMFQNHGGSDKCIPRILPESCRHGNKYQR